MNWALWVVQMISLMGYEEHGRVASPEHLAKGMIGVYNCTVHPAHYVKEFNRQLLVWTEHVLKYRRFLLQDYPPLLPNQRAIGSKRYPEIRLYDGYAEFVGDWRSNSSDIVVQCSVDIANFTTVFQMEKIVINYKYKCQEEEGYLKATISNPRMDIVLLQGRNSNVAYTYGYYPPWPIPFDLYVHPKLERTACQKYYEELVKHGIAPDAYEATYYGIKAVLDVAVIDLQKIITWINP